MSCFLIGLRECSHESAYRTRPLDSCSMLPLPPTSRSPSSISTSSSTSSGVSSRRLRCVWVGAGELSSATCSQIRRSIKLRSSNCTHCSSSARSWRHVCCREVRSNCSTFRLQGDASDAPHNFSALEILASTSCRTSKLTCISNITEFTPQLHPMRPP
jgi:hypothetical protein